MDRELDWMVRLLSHPVRVRLFNSPQVGLADDNFLISLGSRHGTSRIIIGQLRMLLMQLPCSSKTVDQFKTTTWYVCSHKLHSYFNFLLEIGFRPI
jgi:hypothetical protein